MKVFFVHCSGLKKVFEFEDTKNQLNQRLNELTRENILQRSFISQDKNELWLHLHSEDRELAEMIVNSISALSNVKKRIILLDE